jgi:hypothetical protein
VGLAAAGPGTGAAAAVGSTVRALPLVASERLRVNSLVNTMAYMDDLLGFEGDLNRFIEPIQVPCRGVRFSRDISA